MDNNKDRATEILKRLKKKYPDAKVALFYDNLFQLLVAVILSAQCTDKRVNLVTKNLFKKYKTVKDFANSRLNELEQDIRSTGFFRNKAKNIKGSASIILEKFSGEVPKTMDELLTLPGVARKTANIVLGNGFGIIEGIAVDTHVIRISNLLGLTKNSDPVKIERDLMKLIPRSDWTLFSLLIQSLGREICVARKPNHAICPLKDICPSANQ
ncbi:MAG: endonuclease III [Elusimicrobia bacterium]|nr:endonuclease III [Elusimicrobiota bacterium]